MDIKPELKCNEALASSLVACVSDAKKKSKTNKTNKSALLLLVLGVFASSFMSFYISSTEVRKKKIVELTALNGFNNPALTIDISKRNCPSYINNSSLCISLMMQFKYGNLRFELLVPTQNKKIAYSKLDGSIINQIENKWLYMEKNVSFVDYSISPPKNVDGRLTYRVLSKPWKKTGLVLSEVEVMKFFNKFNQEYSATITQAKGYTGLFESTQYDKLMEIYKSGSINKVYKMICSSYDSTSGKDTGVCEGLVEAKSALHCLPTIEKEIENGLIDSISPKIAWVKDKHQCGREIVSTQEGLLIVKPIILSGALKGHHSTESLAGSNFIFYSPKHSMNVVEIDNLYVTSHHTSYNPSTSLYAAQIILLLIMTSINIKAYDIPVMHANLPHLFGRSSVNLLILAQTIFALYNNWGVISSRTAARNWWPKTLCLFLLLNLTGSVAIGRIVFVRSLNFYYRNIIVLVTLGTFIVLAFYQRHEWISQYQTILHVISDTDQELYIACFGKKRCYFSDIAQHWLQLELLTPIIFGSIAAIFGWFKVKHHMVCSYISKDLVAISCAESYCLGTSVINYFGETEAKMEIDFGYKPIVLIDKERYVHKSILLYAGFVTYRGKLLRQKDLLPLLVFSSLPIFVAESLNITIPTWKLSRDGSQITGCQYSLLVTVTLGSGNQKLYHYIGANRQRLSNSNDD